MRVSSPPSRSVWSDRDFDARPRHSTNPRPAA
jgi:hypothetical protein